MLDGCGIRHCLEGDVQLLLQHLQVQDPKFKLNIKPVLFRDLHLISFTYLLTSRQNVLELVHFHKCRTVILYLSSTSIEMALSSQTGEVFLGKS